MNESKVAIEEMLSAERARQFLGISRTTLHRLLSSGALKGQKAGGQWRFRHDELEAYLSREPDSLTAMAQSELETEIHWWRSKADQDISPDEQITIGALSDAIMNLALAQRASEVHVEPRVDGVMVRFRNDGALGEVRNLSTALLSPLLGHFKKLAQLSTSEARIPQRGRTTIETPQSIFLLEVATLPTWQGESLTLRLMPRPSDNALRIGIGELGIPEPDLKCILGWLEQPMGLVLVVGGEESGKDSTLSTLTAHLATPYRKVVAVSEHLDIVVPGALQIEQATSGLSFVEILRAFFHQDPDIIAAGETGEPEAFELLLRGAHNGHLVLAGLEAPSFASAIARLDEMEIEPFLLGTALLGVVAQRLVWRICPDCKVDDAPDAALVERARRLSKNGGYEIPRDVVWKCGAGCPKCRGMGARGRIAIYEVVTKTAEIESAITRCASQEELQHLARQDGADDLFAAGMRYAVEGQTSLAFLLRALALPAVS